MNQLKIVLTYFSVDGNIARTDSVITPSLSVLESEELLNKIKNMCEDYIKRDRLTDIKDSTILRKIYLDNINKRTDD